MAISVVVDNASISFGLQDGNPGRALMKLARSIVVEINDRIGVTEDYVHGGCDGLVGEYAGFEKTFIM